MNAELAEALTRLYTTCAAADRDALRGIAESPPEGEVGT